MRNLTKAKKNWIRTGFLYDNFRGFNSKHTCFLDENKFCDEASTLNTMFLQTGLSKYTYFFDENLVCNNDFTIKHMQTKKNKVEKAQK